MFEDEYRREMNDLRASESLIADTLKKMQDEQAKFQMQQGADATGESEAVDDEVSGAVSRSTKIKKPLFIRIGLPVAACVVIALLGVLIVPQIMDPSEQSTQQHYSFQPVNGNSSLTKGPQFGNVGEQSDEQSDNQQSDGGESNLESAECSEAFLPEGILKATPVTVGGYSVYLGFDEQQTTYYAAYHKDGSSETWVLIQSEDLDEAGFLKALEEYFASL